MTSLLGLQQLYLPDLTKSAEIAGQRRSRTSTFHILGDGYQRAKYLRVDHIFSTSKSAFIYLPNKRLNYAIIQQKAPNRFEERKNTLSIETSTVAWGSKALKQPAESFQVWYK